MATPEIGTSLMHMMHGVVSGGTFLHCVWNINGHLDAFKTGHGWMKNAELICEFHNFNSILM